MSHFQPLDRGEKIFKNLSLFACTLVFLCDCVAMNELNQTAKSRKHTHRGTCQACGRAQAFMIDGVIAKHGYTVDWGFFNGVCMGSDNKPLEHDKTQTEQIIKLLGIQAKQDDQRAADLKSGAVEPKFFKRGKWDGRKCRFEDIECTRAELSNYDASQQIIGATFRAESKARNARSHAAMLTKLIADRHGKPLIPVSTKKELKAGVKVLIGGKKGEVETIVEMRYQEARGCGPFMNGQHLLHAIFKTEDGREWAVPARSIKQAAIIDEGGAQ